MNLSEGRGSYILHISIAICIFTKDCNQPKWRSFHGQTKTGDEKAASAQNEEAEREGCGGKESGEEDVSECIFCKIIAREIPATIVRETDDILAFRDVNPQAPQHILVVPKRHIEKLADLEDADAAFMGKMMIEISKLAHELDMETQGYRLVLNNGSDAGQSVWHVHAHLMSGRPFRWPPG